MAYYKNSAYLTLNNHSAFDLTHHPGAKTSNSGIYRCDGCGHEIVSVSPHPLPPQNHHQHTQAQGHIRWRLVVATTH
ncbi:protein L [Flavisolibacter ginsenosidimutans]|uniref:Protein L n=1 Tax=Flavisolibacter ginsenosidimutans TaxID=661481 RepID=A0A5B8UKZ7_9BACT|nr:protein L [Flavisolibacter ginsenosidimutans]